MALALNNPQRLICNQIKRPTIHLSVYRIKHHREIYKQEFDFEIFSSYFFYDSIDGQNLWYSESIFQEAIQIFPKNFLNFKLETIEKHAIINLSSYSNKSYASIVFSVSKVVCLGKGRMQPFSHFSILFYSYTALHNQRILSSNFFAFRRNFIEPYSFSSINSEFDVKSILNNFLGRFISDLRVFKQFNQ